MPIVAVGTQHVVVVTFGVCVGPMIPLPVIIVYDDGTTNTTNTMVTHTQ